MGNPIIYAAKFEGIGPTENLAHSGRGIALYEIVASYGTAEPMPSSIRNKLDVFCSQFHGIDDVVFPENNGDGGMIHRKRQFRLNEDDQQRRILCTSYDSDYETIVKRLQEASERLGIDLLKDDKALPELMRWIPYLILMDRENLRE